MQPQVQLAQPPKLNRQQNGDIAGWYGALAFLLAYSLVSFSLIGGDGLLFQVLNLTGAIAFVIMSTIKRVRQTMLLNTIWSAIALVAIIRLVA